MEISDNGITFICDFEGFSAIPYDDTAGFSSIGYGHKIRPEESFTSITEDQAKDIMRNDLTVPQSTINNCVTIHLTQNQFDALTSFTYNLGSGTLLRSTLLEKLNAGNTQGAADEFLKWTHAGGIISNGLVRRRTAERDLFLT